MRLSPLPFCLASALCLTVVAHAQVSPGFRMIGPHGTSDTYLLDTTGAVVHTYPSGFTPGNGVYMMADGSIMRAVRLPGGPGPGGTGGGIQHIAFDGTILWDFAYNTGGVWGHHDIEVLPNGNVLLIAWESKTNAEAVAAGRNPATVGSILRPEHIVELRRSGPTTAIIAWEWHTWDHLIQDFDSTKANFGVVANHPELLDINFPGTTPNSGDWQHANSVSYDPVNDWVLLNSPFLNEFWIIDHSTTTAEAAGHTGGTHGMGGDFLYRWGNPAAYQKGTAADQKLFGQHGTVFIEPDHPGGGNVLIFNNQFGGNFSAVHELVLPIVAGSLTIKPDGTYGPDAPVWEYTAPTPTSFFSGFVSNAVRLPNGNTLIDSGAQGWLFEVTPTKQKVWEHFNTLPSSNSLVFQASYYERTLWANTETMSGSAGGTIGFDLVSGTPHAGNFYFLLGSLSGTAPGLTVDGVNIPLNVDPYFLFTLSDANGPILPGFSGTLDGLGKASASLILPPGAAAPIVGLSLQHAFAIVDTGTSKVSHASNAVPLVITP